MRKIVTIFLLLLVGINSIGLYPILKAIQFRAKELAADVILKGITPDLVVFANLHDNKEVKWEEENKEFSYQGSNYDVVKVAEEEGNTLFYCYDDKKESSVTTTIDNIIYKQITGNKDVSQNMVLHLMMMMAQVFIPAQAYSVKNVCVNEQACFTHHAIAGHYPDRCMDIPIPPPWA